MESREVILRVLYRSFLDIRLASSSGDNKRINAISNLMHNVPMAMIKKENDDVLRNLEQRADLLGMSPWLRAAFEDIETNSPSRNRVGYPDIPAKTLHKE